MQRTLPAKVFMQVSAAAFVSCRWCLLECVELFWKQQNVLPPKHEQVMKLVGLV